MRKEIRITDYHTYRFSLKEWILYGAEGAALGGFAVWICYHSVLAMPIAAFLAAVFIREKQRELAEERKRRMNYHFRDFLSSVHTSMLAGYSLENSVRSASKDLEKLHGVNDCLSVEIREIVRQMGFGKQIEQLFIDLGRRSDIEDLRDFGEVVYIAKRTGGSMSRVLDSTWRSLSEKIDTQQEIDTALAARRFEQKIMNFMPAGIVLYLRLTFSGFVEKMYGNAAGAAVMSVCLALYLGAAALGKKIMGEKV